MKENMFKATLFLLGVSFSNIALADNCFGGVTCTYANPDDIGPKIDPGMGFGPIGSGLGPIFGPDFGGGPGPLSGGVQPGKDKDKEKKVCELKVDNLVKTCQNTYTTFTSAAGMFCAVGVFRVLPSLEHGKEACGGIAAVAIASAVNWCSSQGQAKKIRDC